MNQGFSLTDVLVSLLLLTATSLALLKQQWQVSQFVNVLQSREHLLLASDNRTEHLDVQQTVLIGSHSFQYLAYSQGPD